MSCIEHARRTRQRFMDTLQRRGFPYEEAAYLTEIEINHGKLTVYGTLDPGRLDSRELETYRRLFPDAASEIDNFYRGIKTQRDFQVTSGLTEHTDIQPECERRVRALSRFDTLRQGLRME